MNKPIIGLDFSINKPAWCILKDNEFTFYSAPYGLSGRLKKIFRDAGVKLTDRTDEKYKGSDSSKKMQFEVNNSMYIAEEIVTSIPDGDIQDWTIVFEGFSFASSGNVSIQLGGYKYILMAAFFNDGCVPFDQMYTYAPISIKKTAECAKKGMGKKEMIDAFVAFSKDNPLRNAIRKNPDLFKKKTGNWIDHLDDLVDAYWAIETYLVRDA